MNLTTKLATGGVSLVLASGSMLGWINQWEGRKYPVYLDIGGVPTVCEGHTGPEVVLGDTWTKAQCDLILTANATKYGKGVLECTSVPINQNQFDALTLFAINVGIAGMCKSRAVKEINAGRYAQGCNALAYDPKGKPAWSYVNAKFVKGLHNRRLFERELCLKPIEKTAAAVVGTEMPVPPQLVQQQKSLSTFRDSHGTR